MGPKFDGSCANNVTKTKIPKAESANFRFCGVICTEAIKVRPHWTTYWLKFHIYSRVPLMWTPLGRAESVHISEPSTVVDALYCGHLYRKNKRAERKVSTKEECPHRRSVHKGELYCNMLVHPLENEFKQENPKNRF